jgi:hypothetical protein
MNRLKEQNRMMLFRFAFKNLLGAGLRTWLNTIILATTFIVVLFLQGLYDGLQKQTEKIRIAEETGLAQLWFKEFDPLDSLTINDNQGPIPAKIQARIKDKSATPILIATGVIYPQNRLQPTIIKGISPNQQVLNFDTSSLATKEYDLPAIIGPPNGKALKPKSG